jgi:prolyl 4-hydroxylase
MEKERIDGDRIFIIRDFCAEQECDAFVAGSENAGYQDASIKTVAGVLVNKEIRDNARLILDDASLADRLWRRLQPFAPATLEGCRVLALNERFRFYRYDPGQRFAPHFDGYFRARHR